MHQLWPISVCVVVYNIPSGSRQQAFVEGALGDGDRTANERDAKCNLRKSAVAKSVRALQVKGDFAALDVERLKLSLSLSPTRMISAFEHVLLVSVSLPGARLFCTQLQYIVGLQFSVRRGGEVKRARHIALDEIIL